MYVGRQPCEGRADRFLRSFRSSRYWERLKEREKGAAEDEMVGQHH